MVITKTKISKELIEQCRKSAYKGSCANCQCNERECLECLIEELEIKKRGGLTYGNTSNNFKTTMDANCSRDV